MTITKLLILAISLLCFPITSAYATEDMTHVINLAGKQRMLTQKMSKEALLVALDIDKKANMQNLRATASLFDKTLNGLLTRNNTLKLPATENVEITKTLNEVKDLWAGFNETIEQIIHAEMVSDNALHNIYTNNLPLLRKMNRAVKQYEIDSKKETSNPYLSIAVNISGRQRMLIQKMSKEFFFIATGFKVEENRKDLDNTKAEFEKALAGLINGDYALGLKAAPTAEITAQLEKVQGMWATFKTALEGDINEENIRKIADLNIPLLQEMNKAVTMFASLG